MRSDICRAFARGARGSPLRCRWWLLPAQPDQDIEGEVGQQSQHDRKQDEGPQAPTEGEAQHDERENGEDDKQHRTARLHHNRHVGRVGGYSGFHC